jgi:hypothetical protein
MPNALGRGRNGLRGTPCAANIEFVQVEHFVVTNASFTTEHRLALLLEGPPPFDAVF